MPSAKAVGILGTIFVIAIILFVNSVTDHQAAPASHSGPYRSRYAPGYSCSAAFRNVGAESRAAPRIPWDRQRRHISRPGLALYRPQFTILRRARSG